MKKNVFLVYKENLVLSVPVVCVWMGTILTLICVPLVKYKLFICYSGNYAFFFKEQEIHGNKLVCVLEEIYFAV